MKKTPYVSKIPNEAGQIIWTPTENETWSILIERQKQAILNCATDYLQEPDIFHELFGHVPLLSNPTYAQFMHEFGKKALALQPKDRSRLFRLFWFTVEFGLMNTSVGTRAYGAGILSSIGETKYALTDASIKKPFHLLDVLRTPFRVDIMQPLYYVIESFEDLFKLIDCNFKEVLDESRRLGDLAPLFEPKASKIEIEGKMTC